MIADVAALQSDGLQVRAIVRHDTRYCVYASTPKGQGDIPVFCGRCTPYELGFTIAVSCPERLRMMTTVYIAHLLPSFAGDLCDRLLTDTPSLAPLLQVFEDWMMHLADQERRAQEGFLAEHAPDMVAEVAGLLAGARRAGLDERELELRLWTINLASDIVTALLNSGQLHTSFLRFLATHGDRRTLQSLLTQFLRLMSQAGSKSLGSLDDVVGSGFGIACDSLAVKSLRTERVSFARDFQLPNGRAFHKCACVRILRSKAGSCIFESGAVGLCGAVTSAALCPRTRSSLCIGVNMFRALWQPAPRGPPGPRGLPALSVVQAATRAFAGADSSAVARKLSALPRAGAWIFPFATERDAGALETVGLQPLPLSIAASVAREGISSLTTRALVTERALTAGKGWWYSDGSAFRGLNFATPKAIVDANRALFKARAPVTEDADAALDAVLCRGSLHPPRWLGTNFFPLCARNPRVLVASNSALVPILRCFQMRAEPDRATTLTSKGIDWRYISLYGRGCQLAQQPVTLQGLVEAISFLDPKHSSYWAPRSTPEERLAQRDALPVQGTLNVLWSGDKFEETVYGHKSGTWGTPWLFLTCRRYLASASASPEGEKRAAFAQHHRRWRKSKAAA